MAKQTEDIKVSENNVLESVDFKGKTDEELLELAQTLDTQQKQYQTLAIKAQGALEVILQLLPKQKEENDS